MAENELRQQIPGGWKSSNLGSLANYVNGYAFKPSDWEEEGLPIIRIEQLKDPKAECDYSKKTLPHQFRIQQGDLVFSWSASLFLAFWNREAAYLNQHLFKVIERAGTNKCFLKYLIEAKLDQLIASTHGSTMQHITRPDLLGFSVIIPARETEQAKIAEILSTSDEVIEKTEQRIGKLKHIRRGLMQTLFRYGIDENDHIRSEATHTFKDSPLGQIPEEWKSTSIEQITSHVGSGATPKGGESVYLDEGVKFVRSQNVTFEGLVLQDLAHIDEKTHAKMKRSEIYHRDVLLNITGASIGRCCVVPEDFGPANVNQHVCAIRLKKPDRLLSLYLAYFLSSHKGQKQIELLNAGSNREGLNYQQIKSFTVPYPDEKERLMIALVLLRIDGTIDKEKCYRRKLLAIKRGLMEDLLSGKVRVTHLIKKN